MNRLEHRQLAPSQHARFPVTGQTAIHRVRDVDRGEGDRFRIKGNRTPDTLDASGELSEFLFGRAVFP